MLYPALFFLVVGMAIGVFLAFNAFVFPDYFSGEYVHFGRVRPSHVWSVLFLWLLSAGVSYFYYFIPRLCGIPLWSSKMAYWASGFWWFSLLVTTASYPWGTNFGWEYAEQPDWVGWIPVKPIFVLGWVLIVINCFMTIFNRKYKKMYVSLWYAMGALIWTTFIYLAGTYGINMVPGGISRVNVNFFYVHNVVGLTFTPLGLAAAYYFLPKIANVPIYSHRLSMVGFWSIAFFYGWVGAHHLIHGPISQWLQTTSIVFSIWLFIPVWSVIHNLMMTLLPHWNKYVESVPLRFIMIGTMFYFLTCIQGPLQSLRNVNEITSKTDWLVGHAHLALYGAFTSFAIAGAYYVIPSITKKSLWSNSLANWHFSLNMLGSVPFLLSLTIGGLLQGMQWASWAQGTTYAEFHKNLSVMPFLETVADMHVWWIIRGIGGIMILFANLLFVVNMFNTVMLKPRETA